MIEPDEAAQRQLLALLAARGCRVVPVGDADAGLELAQRLRFDAAFCSAHAPRSQLGGTLGAHAAESGAFVLISDRYDPEFAADFEGEGRFVVSRPVREPDLDRVLQAFDR